MGLLKTFLYKIGQFLLSIVRILRKAVCCRKRKDTEYLLPMTIGHVIDMERVSEMTQWEAWPESGNNESLINGNLGANQETMSQETQMSDCNSEDFFKDMVPQIRKPKKVFIKHDLKEPDCDRPSNRLAMDPKAILMAPELGDIDDNPSNWEDNENLDELWDPDALIREKKRDEQEKRRAEHQRRKLEKENRRLSKPESLSSMMLSLSDSKTKNS